MNTTKITTASLGQILAKCPSQVSPQDRVTEDRGDTAPLCHRLKSTMPNDLTQETSSHPSLNWTTERCAVCRWVEDWDYNKMVITRNANDVNKHGLCFKEKRVNSTSPGQTEDISAFKDEILRLVSMNGGKLPLGHIASCYERALKKKTLSGKIWLS